MTTDLYTKIALTVIALCLLCQCVQSVISPRASSAQTDQRVIITGYVGNHRGLPVYIKDTESALPVSVSNRVRIDQAAPADGTPPRR